MSNQHQIAENHEGSLQHASIFKLILTGTLFGIIHVMTGPDHLSALATLSAGSSWRSFSLGMRWGCGHSIGLILIAIIFISLDGHVNLDKFGLITDALVGIFMIALGIYGMYSSVKKYKEEMKDFKGVSVIESTVIDNALEMTVRKVIVNSDESNPKQEDVENVQLNTEMDDYIIGDNPQADDSLISIWDSKITSNRDYTNVPSHSTLEEKEGLDCSNTTHEVSLSNSDITDSDETILLSSNVKKESQLNSSASCLSKFFDMNNSSTQRVVALLVGIVHGIAGPGGILGVLPAVGLHDAVKSFAYLGSFCFTTIIIMGIFAAIYGEATGRLSARSLLIAFRISMISSLFSVIVGIAWIVLLIMGKLQKLFG